MDFFSAGIPLGRYWGINVRLHFTFLIYAYWRVSEMGSLGFGLAFVGGLYFCILLHEFGHALAARWCDGEATDILLWPFGGLAFCRPAFHPTAHLITTVAGPFVTLVLWLGFWVATAVMAPFMSEAGTAARYVFFFLTAMREMNLLLLLFNLIPAFPMDGGRILRDTLWHWLSAEKATKIAIWVSRLIAGTAIVWAIMSAHYWLIFIAVFILLQSASEQNVIAFESSGTYDFSIRERLRRGHRQRAFYQAVEVRGREAATAAMHTCAVCGKTDNQFPALDFRVCTDCANGEEYCPDHLNTHSHR